MKKLAALFCGVVVMFSFSMAAYAVPTITLTNGSVTRIVTGEEPSNADDLGLFGFIGKVGDFSVNVSGSMSNLGISYLHLNSQAISNNISGPSTLDIKFSETGFTFTNPVWSNLFNLQFGGVADGAITFKAFYDNNNILNAETTAIGEALTNPANGAFAATGVGSIGASGPFSLTEEITITHNPGRHDSSFDAVITPVPEPGSLMLLGAGFFGLAIYGKRRRNS
jgi:hypothetical protein